VAHRIMITLRFRVRHGREIRRSIKGIPKGFNEEVFPVKSVFLNLLFLKDYFFLTFSLDKNNIGCPSFLYLNGAENPTKRTGVGHS